MTFQPDGLSISDAINSAQDTYDLNFASWGFRNLTFPTQNMRFPQPGFAALPTTLAGLSIGPASTIDRCWVTWDRQKTGTPTDLTTISRPRSLSLGSPLTYPQTAQLGQLALADSQAVAMNRGLLYVYAYGDLGSDAASPVHTGEVGLTTILPLNYVDQFGVTRTMQNLLAPASFETPFLHLVLNLRSTPAVLTPITKRFPLNRAARVTVAVADPAHTRLAMIPIYGRKNVRVQMTSLANGVLNPQVCNFNVGLLRNLNESPVATGTTPSCEVPAGAAAGVAASSIAAEFKIDNPCADYVVLYATTTVADTTVAYVVTAED